MFALSPRFRHLRKAHPVVWHLIDVVCVVACLVAVWLFANRTLALIITVAGGIPFAVGNVLLLIALVAKKRKQSHG